MIYQKWRYDMKCLLTGAVTRISGAQKRAGGVAGAKYSVRQRIIIQKWDFELL